MSVAMLVHCAQRIAPAHAAPHRRYAADGVPGPNSVMISQTLPLPGLPLGDNVAIYCVCS